MTPGPLRTNPWLVLGAAATALAALAHLACIAIGPAAYRVMGAGPRMAQLAESGHWYPPVITVVIAGVLFVWSAYALAGAGVIRRLPLQRVVLVAITAVFLLRGFARPVLEPWFPGNSDTFWFWSSTICLAIGAVHWRGLVVAARSQNPIHAPLPLKPATGHAPLWTAGAKAAAIIIAGWMAYFLAWGLKPSVWLQLVALPVWLAMLGLLLYASVRSIAVLVRRDRRLWRKPVTVLAAATAALALGPWLGGALRQWKFEYDLPRYEAAVRWAVAQSEETMDLDVVELQERHSSLGRIVHVHRLPECGLMVDFFWANGFPVKHTVRRHAASDAFLDQPSCRTHWRSARLIAPQWYELRD